MKKKIELTKFLNRGRNSIQKLNKNKDGIISSLNNLNKRGRKFLYVSIHLLLRKESSPTKKN